MEMHQVRYFLAVAKHLNFSRAADECNVAQPSLSRAIQQLEGELGGRLFHREHKFTHLSELGEMVRPHLQTVYTAALQAKQLSQEVKQLEKVPLKLGIMSALENLNNFFDRSVANAHRANAPRKCLAVDAVAIANEGIRDGFPPASLADLPSDPFRGRRPCDANPKDSSAVMSKN